MANTFNIKKIIYTLISKNFLSTQQQHYDWMIVKREKILRPKPAIYNKNKSEAFLKLVCVIRRNKRKKEITFSNYRQSNMQLIVLSFLTLDVQTSGVTEIRELIFEK